MNKEEKAAVVEELASALQGAEAIFAVDYRGISVPQAAELRSKLRDADAQFRIVKNSLTERAADKAGADTLRELLEGPTALTFVRGDAAMAAKAIREFSRDTGLMVFKGGVMDGEPVSADEIMSIARLPARDVLHTQLVGTVASPLTGLVRGLNSLISGLASQLGQIAEQGLVTGEPPAEEAPAVEEAPAEEAEAPAEAEEAPAGEPEAPAEEPEAPADEPEPPAEEPPAEEAEAPAGDAPAEEASAETETQENASAGDGEGGESKNDDAAEA